MNEYAATRDSVCAIGKILPTQSRHGGIGYVVLIDANIVVPWSISNPWCLTTVLHELFHVVFKGHPLMRLGNAEDSDFGDTRESLLNSVARSLLIENYVNCAVDAAVHEIATKDNGEPVSLLELEKAKGSDWVEGLLLALDRMPQFIDEKILQFQIGQISIDDIDTKVIPYVKDILILLTHTASIYTGTEHWPRIHEQIKNNEATRRFLEESLEDILSQFSVDRLQFEASVKVVAEAVEGIYRNCGLTFKNVPKGLWISVDSPSP